MKKLAVTLIAVFFCANYSAAEQKNIPAVVVSSADVIKEMEEIIASSYYRQDINARAFAEDLLSENHLPMILIASIFLRFRDKPWKTRCAE